MLNTSKKISGPKCKSSHSSISASTQNVLNTMISNAKLSKRQQCQLLKHIHSSPFASLPATPVNPQTNKVKQCPSKAISQVSQVGPIKPGRRIQHEILRQCDNYQVEQFRPSATKNRELEIERLQHIFGNTKNSTKKVETRSTDTIMIDPIEDLANEIQERRDFLKSLEALGAAKPYRTQIQAEINLRVRDMDRQTQRANEANR